MRETYATLAASYVALKTKAAKATTRKEKVAIAIEKTALLSRINAAMDWREANERLIKTG